MAQCVYCKAETELHIAQVAVCVECTDDSRKVKQNAATVSDDSDDPVRTILFRELVETTARLGRAAREFNTVMDQFPSGLPHPDGTQHIRNASRALSVARLEIMRAHSRLDDFLGRGIVPEDLKRQK